MKDIISAKKGALFVLLIALVFGTMDVLAIPQIPHSHAGTLYIGGTAAPAGATVNVTASTGGTDSWQTTTDANGDWSIDVEFDDLATAGADEGTTDGATLTWLGNGNAATFNAASTSTAYIGFNTAGINLSIDASCTDGLSNGDEVLTDCGGSCGACLTVGSPTTMSATTSTSATQNATTTMTISSGSTSSSTPVILVTIAAPAVLVNSANATDTITLAVNVTSIVQTYGASTVVLITATIPANKSGTYTGTINISNNASLTASQRTVTLTVSAVTRGRRPLRYIEVSLVGILREDICLNEPVLITVIGERYGRALKRSDVDIWYGGVKILYNIKTDENGEAQFTPTKTGDYIIEIEKTGYRELEEEITVIDCEAITTTILEEVTTTLDVEVTTTVEAPLTTIAPTTIAPTTIAPPPTTIRPVTTLPTVAPPAKKSPWMAIIVVLVIVVVVIVVLMKKRGSSGAAEAPKEEASKEEASKEEAPPEEAKEE